MAYTITGKVSSITPHSDSSKLTANIQVDAAPPSATPPTAPPTGVVSRAITSLVYTLDIAVGDIGQFIPGSIVTMTIATTPPAS